MTSGDGREWRSHVTAVRAIEAIDVARRIERRAVRARLVNRAQDWPWSALAERLRPSSGLPLAAVPFLSSASWIAYL